ncbi:MAG: Gfo/Idh/MocA family oxidoreductase [Acidobacteriota bacterium]|nr:Gfo/Idh/MocA family oxidoreductase [Acidobacteriota bacterium]
MESSFRAVVIGVGHLGQHHARILSALDDVDLVGVVDVDRERARRISSEYGTEIIEDIRSVLTRVDGVVVAVPTQEHLSVAAPLLEAGVSVLVEKPMATSSTEADVLVRSAETSGAILAVGHTERHNPAVAVARELISSPRFIEVHRLSTFQSRSLDIDVVFDVMIHDIDIVLSLVGSEPVSLEAVGIPVLTDRVDIANARLRFESGCIANLTASRISREQVRKLRVFQPHALVTVDYAAQQVEAWRVARSNNGSPSVDGGPIEVEMVEPLECELIDFVRSVRDGIEPSVTGVAGRRALAVAEEITHAMEDTNSLSGVGGTS